MYKITGEYVDSKNLKRNNNIHTENSKLKGMVPHPSETEPQIPCHKYYPKYCQQKKVKISNTIPENALVHMGPTGDIEVSYLNHDELITKTYPSSRLPPLINPYSRNIPEYIIKNTWDI